MNIGIITINDNDNYGNRLQNYATQEVLKKVVKTDKILTIRNENSLNYKSSNQIKYILKIIRYKIMEHINKKASMRRRLFEEFNNNIQFTNYTINLLNAKNVNKKFDYFIVGSDQVWNPNGRMTSIDLLTFADDNKKISFSPSIAVSKIENKDRQEELKKGIEKYKSISIRENEGKKIIEKLTNRKDVEVLIDPTMMLSKEEWNKVAKKPKQLKSKKFILNYFLGNPSEKIKETIKKFAKENNCEVINILDKSSPFYQTGPSEFLYLEKNAYLICTDSFHSSIFAILYDRPFIVFDREDKLVKMNSRIYTLLEKFKLENKKYSGGDITKENLECEYGETFEILDKERKKSYTFLKKSLNL